MIKMDAIERIYDEELTNFICESDYFHNDSEDEINEKYPMRKQELRKLSSESNVPNEFVSEFPKFFMPKYFRLIISVHMSGKVLGESKNYFIVPCNYLKRISRTIATIKVDKECKNLINKNTLLVEKKYNSYGIYIEKISDLREVSFSKNLKNISFENICAVKIEIHTIFLYGARIIYHITQLYRRLNLLHFMDTGAQNIAIFSGISRALAQVCAIFNVPTEIIHEIAQYIFIIRKENYADRHVSLKFRTQS